MMQTNPVARSCFTSPEVHVRVDANAVAEPRPFHWLATTRVDDKSAVRCFLSFSDAMLFAASLGEGPHNAPPCLHMNRKQILLLHQPLGSDMRTLSTGLRTF